MTCVDVYVCYFEYTCTSPCGTVPMFISLIPDLPHEIYSIAMGCVHYHIFWVNMYFNSCQSGRVNLMFSPDIADGTNEMLKQLPPSYVICNLSYIWWCLMFCPCMGEYRRIKR